MKYNLNRHSQVEAKKDLLGMEDRFFPKTFVYEKGCLDEKIFGRALKVPETLDNPYNHFSLYRMETLADEEIVPSWSPATFEFFLEQVKTHPEEPHFRQKAEYWVQRFMKRSVSLHRNDFPKIMADDVDIDALITKVQQAENFDGDDQVQDYLRQLSHDRSPPREPIPAVIKVEAAPLAP